MTEHENTFLASFLVDLSWRQGNDSCDEIYLEDTAENRELVLNSNKHSLEKEIQKEGIRLRNGKIATNNFLILNFIKDKFIAENSIEEKLLKDISREFPGFPLDK